MPRSMAWAVDSAGHGVVTVLAEWRIVRFAERSGPSKTTATVRLSGELDVAARAVLREHLAPLATKQVDRLVVDVTGVSTWIARQPSSSCNSHTKRYLPA